MKSKFKYLYPFLLFSVVLLVLIIIEIRHPYFFLQDDNRDYVLPLAVHNYNSLASGELALYNFHQFLGMPQLALGQSGVLYPLNYLCIFLSKIFWGNVYATIDIQVSIYILLGAIGTYYFVKELISQYEIAFFCGFTWALCSFIITVSTSWSTVTSTAAYFPFMIFFTLKAYRTGDKRYIACTVITKLLLFYCGYIQFFIYSVIFEFLFMSLYILEYIYWQKEKNHLKSFVKNYLVSYIFVFIFSLPLLLPMWNQTKLSAGRSSKMSFSDFSSFTYDLFQYIKAILLPIRQFNKEVSWPYLPFLSYIGYIPVLLLLTAFFKYIFINRFKIRSKTYGYISIIVLFIVTFFGSTSITFNKIIYRIPILNRFRWPFKLMFFADFFLIIFVGLVLFKLTKHIKYKSFNTHIFLWILIAIQVLNLTTFYVVSPYRSFAYHTDKIPLTESKTKLLSDGRYISISSHVWSNKGTERTLAFNYASLFGLSNFTGYIDPLISKDNFNAVGRIENYTGIYYPINAVIPVNELRSWGVKWYIISSEDENLFSKPLNDHGIFKRSSEPTRSIYYDKFAYPLSYYIDNKDIKSLNCKNTTNNILLNTNFRASKIITINYLYNKFFQATIDGRNTKLIKNKDNKMDLIIPRGNHKIVIKYNEPFFKLGLFIIIAFLILLLLIRLIKSIIVKVTHKL
ncbi:MAG: hypothetical protein Q8880_09270 [Bacteroidota bacterium]|nr:hypothetical protein [Bacteroidota bacterium]